MRHVGIVIDDWCWRNEGIETITDKDIRTFRYPTDRFRPAADVFGRKNMHDLTESEMYDRISYSLPGLSLRDMVIVRTRLILFGML